MKLELRMRNLNSSGNFPKSGKRGMRDVSCRSAHDTLLWVMDMAGHVTFMYCLQVYLEGKKEVKQI